MNNHKTTLVLSSGAARGLSHIGVIKALIDNNIRIDSICGSSIGALVGACYAKSAKIKDLEDLILSTDLTELIKLADFNLALIFRGFVQGQKVKQILKTIIGDVEFKDLSIPLYIVATDSITGEEVVITEGSVLEAVRASISLPVIFMPVKIKDRFLIDGGVVNPVPTNIAKELGAKYIIVSNVVRPLAKKRSVKKDRHLPDKPQKVIKGPTLLAQQINKFIDESNIALNNFQKYVDGLKDRIPATFKEVDNDMPNIFDVLTQSLYAMQYKIAQTNLKQADMVITPDSAHINTFEFFRGKEAIDIGYKAAQEALNKVTLPK